MQISKKDNLAWLEVTNLTTEEHAALSEFLRLNNVVPVSMFSLMNTEKATFNVTWTLTGYFAKEAAKKVEEYVAKATEDIPA